MTEKLNENISYRTTKVNCTWNKTQELWQQRIHDTFRPQGPKLLKDLAQDECRKNFGTIDGSLRGCLYLMKI